MHSNIYPPIYIDKTANFKEKNIIRAAYAFEQSREFVNWSLNGKEEK